MDPGVLGVMIPVLAVMIGGFVVFSRSNIGRALADRIAGHAAESTHLESEVRELRAEVDSLRAQITDAHERLDFAERLLAGQRKES